MAEGGLLVANSIKVLTQNGQCQIDLCLGDITKLPKKDKVDVIVISAFRGDYSPTPTSVIGALKRNLGFLVHNLAKDKEEDLRNLYSCWWSKPLPSKLPYKRLLCFETRRMMDGRPQELVANVFRCLVPILNNEDGSVISPLLNTGDQGYGEVSMLNGMVEAAVNWMKAGLPLRMLKLVLYANVVDGVLKSHTLRRFDEVLKKFSELKERYEMQLLIPKAVPLEFDVYLSFSKEDEEVVKVIREKLRGTKDGIRIFDSSNQALNRDIVFQRDMYSFIMKSARVITVLSPNYLRNKECIEQYNIALCCNRRAHRDILAPFYVDSVELMPTYMGLVQYVDCRPHDSSKITEACSQLTVSLTVTVHTEITVAECDPLRYDIFLSYSHRDTEKANLFVKKLQKLAPDLKLFFDVQELKTGKSWQRTLYHSIDGSRCMLALISAPYLKSAVCQEEFALAQAKHYSQGKQHLQLIPVCLEELDSIEPEFTHIPMVKGTPDVLEDTVNTICPAVIQWLKGEVVHTTPVCATIFNEDDIPVISPTFEMETFRMAQFRKEFGNKDKLVTTIPPFPPPLHNILTKEQKDERPRSAADCDIIFSYHSDDGRYVNFMAKLFQMYAPTLKVKAVASNEHEKLNSLERSDCIIAILSPNYLESPECVEEFHIGIWRQRISDPNKPLLFPIRVYNLPQKPTYFHLMDCPISLTDDLWAQLIGRNHVGLPSEIDEMRAAGLKLSRPDSLALLIATYKILQRFASARSSNQAKEQPPHSAFVNVMRLRERIQQLTNPDFTQEITKNLLDMHMSAIPESWRKENQYIHQGHQISNPPAMANNSLSHIPAPTQSSSNSDKNNSPAHCTKSRDDSQVTMETLLQAEEATSSSVARVQNEQRETSREEETDSVTGKNIERNKECDEELTQSKLSGVPAHPVNRSSTCVML